jgi:hypothetical protein
MSKSPIASASTRVVEAFSRIIADLNNETSVQLDINQTQVLDALGRFRVWAGNIGALQDIKSATSLDARLQKATRITTHFVDRLEELLELLEEGKSPI